MNTIHRGPQLWSYCKACFDYLNWSDAFLTFKCCDFKVHIIFVYFYTSFNRVWTKKCSSNEKKCTRYYVLILMSKLDLFKIWVHFEHLDSVLGIQDLAWKLIWISNILFNIIFRNLQNRINEAIVSVQAVTANPKTDTRLGKVGR